MVLFVVSMKSNTEDGQGLRAWCMFFVKLKSWRPLVSVDVARICYSWACVSGTTMLYAFLKGEREERQSILTQEDQLAQCGRGQIEFGIDLHSL